MNPIKLSRERVYFICSLKFIYRTLNQINSSIEINTIYTVYMTVDVGRERTMADWKCWEEARALAKDRDKWRKSSAPLCATEREEDR